MFKFFAERCLAPVIALLLVTVVANAGQWQVVRASGQVWINSESAQRASLGSASILPSGATVFTGKNGRVLLGRGAETIVVGPNTVVILPQDRGGYTTILQRAGEIVFDVEKRNVKHFAVETPHLAAVVKGTRFTVRITPTGSVVSIDRGLVGVTNLATGEMADVPRGQDASVIGLGAKLTITGDGKLTKIKQGIPRPPLLAPLSQKEVRALKAGTLGLTNGLALGLTSERSNPNGNGVGVGQGGGNAGGNGNGNAGGNGNGNGKGKDKGKGKGK